MCTLAPASTTISLSSGFIVDGAGKLHSWVGEKSVALSFSLSVMIFLASLHASPRAHRSCLSVCADEEVWLVFFSAMDLCFLECSLDAPQLFVPFRQSDLSSAKEPILFLNFLFLQTDLFLEVRILDDLVQSRCNPPIHYFKILEMNTLYWSRGFFSSTQELTWVLNLIFQHENDEGVWEFMRTEAPRFAVFAVQPWQGVCDVSNIVCGLPKNVSLCFRQSPCIIWHASVAAQHRSRTWNDCRLTGNARKFPTVIRFKILKFSWIMRAIHPLLQLLYLCSELQYCIMTFSQFTSGEFVNSRISWALFNSLTSWILLNCVSRSTLSRSANSSWSLACSFRDS